VGQFKKITFFGLVLTSFLGGGKTLFMLVGRALSRIRWADFTWDQVGISLSALCAVHCALTPLVILFLPVMIGKSYDSPLFHIILALLIIPIGLRAFMTGFRHHKRMRVFYLGIPGLLIVGIVPVLFSEYLNTWSEPLVMIIGSTLLISAHWYNRKSCSCKIHGGH
jgi:hypothetical protein